MQNGAKTVMSRRQHKPAASFAARSMRWTWNAARPDPKGPQNAQRSYERYLALARAEALSGNMIGALYMAAISASRRASTKKTPLIDDAPRGSIRFLPSPEKGKHWRAPLGCNPGRTEEGLGRRGSI